MRFAILTILLTFYLTKKPTAASRGFASPAPTVRKRAFAQGRLRTFPPSPPRGVCPSRYALTPNSGPYGAKLQRLSTIAKIKTPSVIRNRPSSRGRAAPLSAASRLELDPPGRGLALSPPPSAAAPLSRAFGAAIKDGGETLKGHLSKDNR